MLTIHYTYDDARVCLPNSKKRTLDRTHGTIGRVLRPVPSARSAHREAAPDENVQPLCYSSPRGDDPAGDDPARALPRDRPRRARRRESGGPGGGKGTVDGAQAQPEHPEPDLRWVHRRVASQGAGADSILVQRFFFACVRWMDGWTEGGRRRDGRSGRRRMGTDAMYFARFGNRGLDASDAGDAFRNGRGFRIILPRPGSAAVKTKQSVALVSGYPDARDRRATRRATTMDGTNAMRSVRVVSRRR